LASAQRETQADLLNPNMTAKDEQVIEVAAQAGVDEASREAAEALRQEVQVSLDTGSGKGTKTALLISVSTLLGVAAVIAVLGVSVYWFRLGESAADETLGRGPGENTEDSGVAVDALSADTASLQASIRVSHRESHRASEARMAF